MKNQSQNIRKRMESKRDIAELLTLSANQLDEDVLSALKQARTIALQKQRTTQTVFSLSAISHRAHLPNTASQWVAATLLLAAIAVGVTGYWQTTQTPLDISILTDDLPLEVFVDQ